MKYLLYPIGYDPQVASGPTPEYMSIRGIEWTEEETRYMIELEKEAEVVEVESEEELPRGRWAREI